MCCSVVDLPALKELSFGMKQDIMSACFYGADFVLSGGSRVRGSRVDLPKLSSLVLGKGCFALATNVVFLSHNHVSPLTVDLPLLTTINIGTLVFVGREERVCSLRIKSKSCCCVKWEIYIPSKQSQQKETRSSTREKCFWRVQEHRDCYP